MTSPAPLFTAVSSSARQLSLLLRCISTANKAHVRISPEGLRISTEEGSVTESFVFLEKSLFTTYTHNAPAPASSQDDPPDLPLFQIALPSLLETLNIFTLADASASSKRDPDAFAAHRLNRHAGINAFSSAALGVHGICTFTYAGEGSPLSIHMSEAGVTTTCDLTTYDPETVEEIPFRRDALALKTIMRSSNLLDAVNELSALNPTNFTIIASPSRSGTELSLTASGNLGSAAVDFTTHTASETPVLETFHCSAKTTASFRFGLVKAAQRAMAAATKVSLRLDEEGVLSLQFLIEVDTAGSQGTGGENNVAFVDFKIVPLVEGEAEGGVYGSDSSDD